MKVVVICPTYNESKNILELISKILSIPIDIDILIVDDNSPDKTADIVKKLQLKSDKIHLLNRKNKEGLGKAYCAGFEWALINKYDKILQMDADLSHNPNDILKLLDSSKKFDLVIGSRYINGVNVINWPIRRLLLSYFANLYARFIIGLNIRDLTGGYKCFNKQVLQSINLNKIKSQGYSFQIEVNFIAWMNGFKLKEIPITFTDRTIGESKMNKFIIFEAILMVPKLFLKKLYYKK